MLDLQSNQIDSGAVRTIEGVVRRNSGATRVAERRRFRSEAVTLAIEASKAAAVTSHLHRAKTAVEALDSDIEDMCGRAEAYEEESRTELLHLMRNGDDLRRREQSEREGMREIDLAMEKLAAQRAEEEREAEEELEKERVAIARLEKRTADVDASAIARQRALAGRKAEVRANLSRALVFFESMRKVDLTEWREREIPENPFGREPEIEVPSPTPPAGEALLTPRRRRLARVLAARTLSTPLAVVGSRRMAPAQRDVAPRAARAVPMPRPQTSVERHDVLRPVSSQIVAPSTLRRSVLATSMA